MKKQMVAVLSLVFIGILSGCMNNDNQTSDAANIQSKPTQASEAVINTTPSNNNVSDKPIQADLSKIGVSYATEEELKKYANANKFSLDDAESIILFSPSEHLKDFSISHVDYDGDKDKFNETKILYSIPLITPEKPLLLRFSLPDTPGIMIAFEDESGKKQSYVVAESGEDGSIFLIEQGVETMISTTYEVMSNTIAISSTKVSYPVLKNFPDTKKEEEINAFLAQYGDLLLNEHKGEAISLDYAIQFQGSDVLGVRWLDVSGVKSAAYPTNVIHTLNMDLKKVKPFHLAEIVQVNKSLVDKFLEGNYQPYSDDLNLEISGNLNDVLKLFDKDELLKQFEDDGVKFYFSEDSLVISAEVPHAVGDHIEMAIPYGELGNMLLIAAQ